MSLAFDIQLMDGATPALRKRMGNLTPARLAAVVGGAVTGLVQAHLRRLPANRHGWPSTHFYSRAADATSWQGVPEGVLIRIRQPGFPQRVFGGNIHPVHAKKLAIPVDAAAYGHSPREFTDLTPLFRVKEGRVQVVALMRAEAVWFWLVDRVVQLGDRTVIPSPAQMRVTALRAIQATTEKS